MARPDASTRYPDPTLPQLLVPPMACDCHAQVMGPRDRFAYVARAEYLPEDAPKETLFLRHALLGFDRGVLVQASCHGSDNGAVLEAIASGGGAYRGVAIIDPRDEAAGLDRLEAAGIIGVRLDFSGRLHGRLSEDERNRMLDAASLRGWHLEIDAGPDTYPALEALLRRFPGKVVLTQMGGVRVGDTAGRDALCKMLTHTPRLWIKLNGAAQLGATAPEFAESLPLARAIMEVAPDRCVWGTGWPHAALGGLAPDDGKLVDLLEAVCTTPADLLRLLVDNPGRLYWPEQG